MLGALLLGREGLLPEKCRLAVRREKKLVSAADAGACDARLVNYVTIVERRVNKGYLPLIEAKNVRIARTHTHASRYVLRRLLAPNRRAMALARGRHLGSIGAGRRRDKCARKHSFRDTRVRGEKYVSQKLRGM